MGYSAIGSAQDLVAALRRKGFLHTPDKQSARSLVLTPKAIALHEPAHQSTEDTYVVHCFESLPEKDSDEVDEERIGTMRMSVGMFKRPYPAPENLFGLQSKGDAMVDSGIFDGDWLIVHRQEDVEAGHVAVVQFGDETIVRTIAKDRTGVYLRPENVSYPIIRKSEDTSFSIVGEVLGVQRVLDY